MSNSIKISGVVITYNEEKNIARCLDSLIGVCDEIVVVDSFSNDNTQEICAKYNTVFIEHKFEGFVEQKNFAMQSAKYNHVLSLDADEEVSETLKQNLLEIKNKGGADALIISRLNNYCGKFIHHGAWYPDAKIRFWDRRLGQWHGKKVHEKVEMQVGVKPAKIKGDILHYSYQTVEEHIARTKKYAQLSAEEMVESGKNISFLKLIINPSYKFIVEYFFRAGFLDGMNGLIIATINSYATFLKYKWALAIMKIK